MKTKIFALLLWFFLGLFGAHMLYLKRLPRVGIYWLVWAFIIFVDTSDEDVGLAGVALLAMWIYDLVWIIRLPRSGKSQDSYPESEEPSQLDTTEKAKESSGTNIIPRLFRLALVWALCSAMIGISLWAGFGFDVPAASERLGIEQQEDLIALIFVMGFLGSIVAPVLFQPALGNKKKYWPFFISICFWGAVLNFGAEFLEVQDAFGLEDEDYFAWLFGISAILSALALINFSDRHCVWCGGTNLEFQSGDAGDGFWEWRNKDGSPDKRHKDNRMLYGYTSVWTCEDCSASTQFQHFVSEKPSKDENVWEGILLSEGEGKRSSKDFEKDATTITTSGSRRRGEQ